MSGDDLGLLRETAAEVLAELSSSAEVRRQMADPDGWSAATWRRLCGELGFAGLAVPEKYGGSGLSAVELGVVFEQAGRSLLCGPLLATAGLAIPLLLLLDDEDAKARYLPDLCAGSMVGTVVTSDADGRSALTGTAVRAWLEDGALRLTGKAGFVVDGARADLLLVPALLAGEPSVLAVAGDSPGLGVEPLAGLDLTRRMATVTFDGVPAHRLATPDAGWAIGRAADFARAMLGCEQAGGAAWCLDDTVSYVTSRIQFGRPIGSFQAIKQKAADMLIRVESARSAAIAAAQSAADHMAVCGAGADPPRTGRLPELPEIAVTAAVAQLYCSDAYVAVAGENIQMHGGIGFTWEHDAHLHYKRAWTSRELLGRPEHHLDLLSAQLSEVRTGT